MVKKVFLLASSIPTKDSNLTKPATKVKIKLISTNEVTTRMSRYQKITD